MRINSNILSLTAQRTLAQTTKALARSMERLASGTRVNFARDDAAGLAIGNGLEAQRRGMLQVVRNINDAKGFLDTADGAMAVQVDLIQRMRELALQSSNGTLSDVSRAYLNSEFQSLLLEFDRIATQTEFNGSRLLDGSFDTQRIQVGTHSGDRISVDISSARADDIFEDYTEVVGSGTFQSRTTLANEANSDQTVAADVNGDSFIDLLSASAANGRVSISLGNGDGTFRARTTVSAANAPFYARGLNLEDVDEDGQLDLLVADYNGYISLLLGNGDGTFQARTTINVAEGWYRMDLGDLNGDGNLDIVAAVSLANSLYIFLGNGNGTFQAPTTYSATFTYDIKLADLNNDSHLDILGTRADNDTINIRLGNGNGTFGAPQAISTSDENYQVLAIDLNSDNSLDMVSVGNGDSTMSVHLGNGNGTFQARRTIATGSGPFDLEGADLNNDDFVDLVVMDSGGATASVFFGNGDGTFQARVTYATGTTPYSVVITDLNGDDVHDIVATDRGNATLSILLGNTTTNENPLSIASQTYAEDVLDILSDGLAELSERRATIGALQSRLDYASSSAGVLVENLSASKAQIMDADYAEEMAEFTRLQVLQQAGVSVLAQANLSTKLALELMQNL